MDQIYACERRLNAPMQGSIPRIDDGAEEVGNLNSSVQGEGRNLNVLRR